MIAIQAETAARSQLESEVANPNSDLSLLLEAEVKQAVLVWLTGRTGLTSAQNTGARASPGYYRKAIVSL